MKTSNQLIKSIFILLICFVIASCSKDSSDPAPAAAAGVEGSWNMTAITVSPAVAGISDFLAYTNTKNGNDCLTKITFIFKADGTLDGTVPTGCQDTADDNDFVNDKSTWKVVGNKIQLTEGTDVTEFDLEVNKTEMKWSEDDDFSGTKTKVTIVFKRV